LPVPVRVCVRASLCANVSGFVGDWVLEFAGVCM